MEGNLDFRASSSLLYRSFSAQLAMTPVNNKRVIPRGISLNNFIMFVLFYMLITDFKKSRCKHNLNLQLLQI